MRCERVQGSREGRPARIVEHPDVRRMLLRMKALTQAARALAYYCAGQTDRASLGDAAAQARADLLTPLVKAYGTDVGVEVASLGVQVHGGMGYIEETGAAQHYRDARISPDLRRHERHPGGRPGRAQAGDWKAGRCSPRCSPRSGPKPEAEPQPR